MNLDRSFFSKKNIGIAIVVIVVVTVIVFYFSYNKKEKLENISKDDEKTVNEIYNYFTLDKDVDYINYLTFLKKIKNTNLEIINADTFGMLKALHKRKLLTKNDIMKEMKIL